MYKLLIICGPTATGKTSVALNLAKKFKGELISADSRQVYKYLDIGTGKDIPKGAVYKYQNSKLGGFYKIKGTKIWGYDLVDPKKEFSVSHYQKFARNIIKDIWSRNRLPILVGGTGLYINSVTEDMPTMIIPKNKKLRKSLEEKSVKELYSQLAVLDPIKAASLNISDKKNPRRLIRAIEIAVWKVENKGYKKKKSNFPDDIDIFKVGLKLSGKNVSKRIKKRIIDRIDSGFSKEVSALMKRKISWKSQAMNSIGYQLWRDFLKKEKTKDEVLKEWENQEKKYAKRQMTWFKKDNKIKWFNSVSVFFPKNVENVVNKWYKKDA